MKNKYPEKKLLYFRTRIIKWNKTNFQNFPWRFTKNRWHALAAEIMLQRTKAEQVAPVYNSFRSKYKNSSDYLKDKKANLFESLGLAWRNRELKKLAGILSKKGIPQNKEELLKLPGIGEYISAAFRSLHLGIRDFIIDSNVVRIYGRYFGFPTDGETRRKKWLKVLSEKITPKKKFREFNYGLIDFTRTVCRPKPLCESCPIKRNCEYYSNKSLE